MLDKHIKMLSFFELKHSEAIEPHAGKLHCKRGCSYCCHLSVSCYRFEAEIIANYIKELPRTKKKWLTQKLQIAVNNKSTDPVKILRSNSPCPFLFNNLCEIYEVRPINCRSYHSTDYDNCVKTYKNPNLQTYEKTITEVRKFDGSLRTVIENSYQNEVKYLYEGDLSSLVAKQLGISNKSKRHKK